MKYNKKQKESIKIINELVKKDHGKCKGGAMANVIGNFTQNKDMQDMLKFYKIITSNENRNLRRAIISIPIIYFSLKLEKEEEKKAEENQKNEEKKDDTKPAAENQNGGAKTAAIDTSVDKDENKPSDKDENKPVDKNENKPADKNENKKSDADDEEEEENDNKKTKNVCENHNNNKIKEEKTLKIPGEYIDEKGKIDYKKLRENYKKMIKNPPQQDKKGWFNLDFLKKKKIENDKLFEKGDIKTFLNELNKINMQDLPIELVTTLFFIKDEIDGKIDIAQEKQQKGEKIDLKGLIDEDVPDIKELKMMLKVVRKICPIAPSLTRFVPNFPEDEFGVLKPDIFCALLKLLDKLDKKKFESTMPSYDKEKLKLIIFKLMMNDLNNGITVTSKCGFFPAKMGDIKQNALGPGIKNALMKHPGLARFKNRFSSQGAMISEIFSYVKDFGEILCDYGIDLELIIFNANKSGIETGFILEILFTEIVKEIEKEVESFGFSVEDITGFSIGKIINDIFTRLHEEGLYNCRHRHVTQPNIKLHTAKETYDKIGHNKSNKIRKIFNELFNDDIFGSFGDIPGGLPGGVTVPGVVPGGLTVPGVPKIGGTRKKSSRKPKKTRKRYKR
jgi:hypothetical protein